MPLYIRKRIKIAPGLSLNISKSGLGLSAGPRGFKVSHGPRGTQINAGRGGIYYRKSLNGKVTQRSKSAPVAQQAHTRVRGPLPQQLPVVPPAPIGQFNAVVSQGSRAPAIAFGSRAFWLLVGSAALFYALLSLLALAS